MAAALDRKGRLSTVFAVRNKYKRWAIVGRCYFGMDASALHRFTPGLSLLTEWQSIMQSWNKEPQ
jgi:hypothetical protein